MNDKLKELTERLEKQIKFMARYGTSFCKEQPISEDNIKSKLDGPFN